MPGLRDGSTDFPRTARQSGKSFRRIDYPVQVYDAEEIDGTCFIAMEFVRGMDLKSLLSAKSPLPGREALNLAAQAAKGLAAAARQGFIHRDIKPANLMLTAEFQLRRAGIGQRQTVRY